jgi:uncharacterized membrane protein
MQLLLLIAYPICVHYAVVTMNPEAQLLALVLLAAGVSLPGIKKHSVFSWLVLLSVMLLSVLISYLQLTMYVLYIPPIIIPLLLFSVFFRSLQPNETPMTTRIGETIHGSFSPDMRNYSRQVTVLWCVFFILLTLWSAMLPIYASDEIWSLFTSFINYLLVALLFVAEYFYRKWRFRTFNHLSFWQYMEQVVKADIRKL